MRQVAREDGLLGRTPAAAARVAGALYVAIILLGGFAEIVGRQSVVTPGDPTATAYAIAAHEALYRLGFAAEALTNLQPRAGSGVRLETVVRLSGMSRRATRLDG